MNTQPFSQTGQMTELCCEYLSVRCIWLYVIIMSRTSFGVNPHSIVYLNVKELLARSRQHICNLSDSNVIWTHSHLVRKRTPNHLANHLTIYLKTANFNMLWIKSNTDHYIWILIITILDFTILFHWSCNGCTVCY